MTGPRDGEETRPVASASWADLAASAPDGLALVDGDARFMQVNPAGIRLCGVPEDSLIGSPAPFPLAQAVTPEPAGLFGDGPGEQVTTWTPPSGLRREFAYRIQRLAGEPARTVVGFRDVTEERHRQRRIATVARSAANLASQGSLPGTLDALAREVLQTDALAGVQILAVDEGGHGLRIMGSAGFRHWPDFFDRLIECRERGASLRMLDALRDSDPIVVPHRWQTIESDPAWEPLHEYLGELHWDSFASVPLIIRGRASGVLNAYFAPGQVVGGRTLEFLVAMAEQAAVAIDYAALMQRERDVARRQERQRLARDLHDSIVQQVFSISMQAKSMEVLAQRSDSVAADAVRRISDEVALLSHTVLADLRAMVHELRPSSTTELGGLEEAIRALAESTTNRTGLRFRVVVGQGVDGLHGELAEDVYRIAAEAIHNVVKHAEAGTVTIRLSVRDGQLRGSVADDGRGLAQARESVPGSGYGLKTMRERAQRWDGTVTVKPRRDAGTIVRLVVPLGKGFPLGGSGTPVEITPGWAPPANSRGRAS
ncbi:sensor histidine kinase [Saccharopolyspora pogona]|uniref:sensor histidine kinase n=1 Tax=Saccharopolyspora pogona TaxID=333966 RepID=UPI001686F903|nr:ATP-binding protein [Saccharopolyspora pogona]